MDDEECQNQSLPYSMRHGGFIPFFGQSPKHFEAKYRRCAGGIALGRTQNILKS
jgi:hypothetical protein